MKHKSFLIPFIILFFVATPLMAEAQPTVKDIPMSAEKVEVKLLPVKAGADTLGQGLITIDFTEADIQTVLKVLAMKGNVNIVASPDVKGFVTINLKDVPWKSAFETILRTYGFVYERDGNIYQVFSAETLRERQLEDVRSEVITLEYATLDQVKDALEKVLSPQGEIESIKGTNQIVISDTSSKLRRALNLVESIDNKQPQVLIDAKIVRTALSKGEQLGLDWNTVVKASGSKRPWTFPFMRDANSWLDGHIKKAGLIPSAQTQILDTTTQTATGATSTSQEVDFPLEFGFPYAQNENFSFGSLDFSQFTVAFNLIMSRKNTKIISNPRIVALNHQSALVQVGGEVGIPKFERNETTGSFEVSDYEAKRYGIVLNVTPHITKDREITVDIVPEITNFLGFIPIGGTNLSSPQFETITAKTNVLVHSGDTIVIGGLITDDEEDSYNKVPYLHSIPLVGWLFKYLGRDPQLNRKAETIFFVTVTLLDDVYSKKALADAEKSQSEYEKFRKESEEEFWNQKKEKEEAKKKKELEKAERKKEKEGKKSKFLGIF